MKKEERKLLFFSGERKALLPSVASGERRAERITVAKRALCALSRKKNVFANISLHF